MKFLQVYIGKPHPSLTNLSSAIAWEIRTPIPIIASGRQLSSSFSNLQICWRLFLRWDRSRSNHLLIRTAIHHAGVLLMKKVMKKHLTVISPWHQLSISRNDHLRFQRDTISVSSCNRHILKIDNVEFYQQKIIFGTAYKDILIAMDKVRLWRVDPTKHF